MQTVAQSLSSSSARCSEPLGQMLLITAQHQTHGCFHQEHRSGSEMWASHPEVLYFNSLTSLSKAGNLQVFTSAARDEKQKHSSNKRRFYFHVALRWSRLLNLDPGGQEAIDESQNNTSSCERRVCFIESSVLLDKRTIDSGFGWNAL